MPVFHEVQFPPKIAYGATGGPEFNTTITTTFGGFEQRNVNWQKARGRWDVSTGIKSKADMDAVIAFFRARFGKAYGFRFKDWSDYQGVGQSIGTGNGSKTEFQLIKTYVSGGETYVREIRKPVNGSVQRAVLPHAAGGHHHAAKQAVARADHSGQRRRRHQLLHQRQRL